MCGGEMDNYRLCLSGCLLGLVTSMLLAKRWQRCPAQFRDRAHPLARIHMYLHQDKPDRLVDVAAGKDQQERCLPHEARQADAGQHQGVHERAVRCIAG